MAARTGIEQRGSPAFAEKNPTNPTLYNFLTQTYQTRRNRPHNQTRPRHGEGSWYRPKRGEDRIERGRSARHGKGGFAGALTRRKWAASRSRTHRAGRQGRDRQTGLTGSAEAAAGSPRGYWSCPSGGKAGPWVETAPAPLAPPRQMMRRSGRRSRNAKQTHGPPGSARPLRASPFPQRIPA